MTDTVANILLVCGIAFAIILAVALYLSTAPSCTCGDEDCGGSCIRSKRRPAGTR